MSKVYLKTSSTRAKPCCAHMGNTPVKKFSISTLDFWQTEYETRPYRTFKFMADDFEKRLLRKFNSVKDLQVILQFLRERPLFKICLVGLKILPQPFTLMYSFAESLVQLRHIELKYMDLPVEFFRLLANNAIRMVVRELSVEGTVLKIDDIKSLREFLIISNTLEYLNVSNCKINQPNFGILADGIYKSKSIRGMSCTRLLQKMALKKPIAGRIVAILITRHKLEDIEMQQCDIRAQDMKYIAEFMSNKCSQLLRLNLASNKLGAGGALYLMNAVVKSQTLRYLDISNNDLGSEGGRIIAKSLIYCKSLVYLDITYNGIGAEAMNAIFLSIKKPLQMDQIRLYGNHFNVKSANLLRRLLERHLLWQRVLDVAVTFDDASAEHRIVAYN